MQIKSRLIFLVFLILNCLIVNAQNLLLIESPVKDFLIEKQTIFLSEVPRVVDPYSGMKLKLKFTSDTIYINSVQSGFVKGIKKKDNGNLVIVRDNNCDSLYFIYYFYGELTILPNQAILKGDTIGFVTSAEVNRNVHFDIFKGYNSLLKNENYSFPIQLSW